MHLSSFGLRTITQFEGFRPITYLDSAGQPTIGYGHKLQPGENFPDGLTESQARRLLARDAATAEQAISRFVRIPLTQGQFDALADFVFNLGARRLATSTLLHELNDGNIGAAALEFLKWDHCGTRENACLKTRREAEMRLFLQSDPATTPLSEDSPHLVPA
ncbi:MAG TPA: lysozyme [Terracidiphilus sp.]|jgi:lysozyme|nr:lysozyme [Terracidiphilus sp.]